MNVSTLAPVDGLSTGGINGLGEAHSVNLDSLNLEGLESDAFGIVTSAYDKHNFLKQVIGGENVEELSSDRLREIQTNLEEFTIQSQLIGKTVSTITKDIDTLVKIQ